MRNLLLIILLFASGCGANLRIDPYSPAIQSNYPTAELWSQGKLAHGMAFCSLVEGQELDDCDFKIQAYYKGTISVVSTACDINDFFSYDKSPLISYRLDGRATSSCIVTVIVSPDYDVRDNPIVVHSFKGYLYVRVNKVSEQWMGVYSKAREDIFATAQIPVEQNDTVHAILNGCGLVDKEMTYEPNGGFISLNTDDLFKPLGPKRCAIQGVYGDNGQIKYFTWMMFGYKKDFSPLPTPTFSLYSSFGKKKVKFMADKAVSILSLDNDYNINYEASFSYSPGQSRIFRALTVSGRSVVCNFNGSKMECVE